MSRPRPARRATRPRATPKRIRRTEIARRLPPAVRAGYWGVASVLWVTRHWSADEFAGGQGISYGNWRVHSGVSCPEFGDLGERLRRCGDVQARAGSESRRLQLQR